MHSKLTERAKTAWNSIADEFNQWDALGLDEQETYVAITAALVDVPAEPVGFADPIDIRVTGRAFDVRRTANGRFTAALYLADTPNASKGANND